MFLPIILLIIIFSFAINISYKFKFKIATSIFLSFTVIGLILYIFGLFNLLNLGYYIILFISGILTIYSLYLAIMKKVKLKDILTLGSVIFIFVTIILFFITKDSYFTIWDEFSHWGPNLKSMLELDELWGSKNLSLIHGNYPPMAGIMEYFVCKLNNGFSEGIAYFALNIFGFSFIILLFRNLTFKNTINAILFLFIIFRLIYLFGFSIHSLYIDLIMGIMFFVIAVIVFDKSEKTEKIEEKERVVIISSILMLLVLTKNIGIIFAAIILLLFFALDILPNLLMGRKQIKIIKKDLTIFTILILLTVIPYFTWSFYNKINNTVNDMSVKESIPTSINKFTKSLFLKEYSNPKYNDITYSYYVALNEKEIISDNFIFKTVIQIIVLANIIGIYIYVFLLKNKEEKKRLIYYLFVMNIGMIIFSAFILFLCLFIFSEYEGRILASFDRYNGTYLIALLLSVIGILITRPRSEQPSTPLLVVISLLLLLNINIIDTFKILAKNDKTPIGNNIIELADLANKNIPKNDNVYLIYQNTSGIYHHHMRYLISPVKTNVFYWSLGEQYYENDIWTNNIEPSELNHILCEGKYSYIIFSHVDKQFIELYGEIFKAKKIEQLDQKIFKITSSKDCELSFEEVQ